MYNLVLCDDKNKTEQHIILTEENGKITVSGYAREKGKKKPLSSNAMTDFVELIRLKDFSKYIGEVEGYKLYEDEYEYIHFFKGDKEDYTKFLLFNGKSAILNSENYEESPEKQREYHRIEIFNKVLEFLTKGLAIILSIVIVVEGVRIYFSNIALVEAFKAEMSATYTECNTLEDVIDRINAQDNLSDEEKEILTNREILATAIKYSDGEILEKLGWGIQIVNANDETSVASIGATGYYIQCLPHVISIDDDLKDKQRKQTMLHEWGHSLQNPMCPLFLRELDAVEKAELGCGYCLGAYHNGYINYGLLKAIVGDEAIKECVHRLDDDYDAKLKAELCKYITEDQCKELMKKLDCGSSNVVSSLEYNKELYAVLLEIATLKYGEENVAKLKALVENSLRVDSITNVGVYLNDAVLYGLCTETRYHSKCTIYVKKITKEEYGTYFLGYHTTKDGVRIDDLMKYGEEYYLCYYAREGELPPTDYELYWGNSYTEVEFVDRTFKLPPKRIEEKSVEQSFPRAIYSPEDLFYNVLTASAEPKTQTRS